MALSENATKLTNLFNPQVVADILEKKLTAAIKFAPLAKVDTTLVGNPGNEVSLPSYTYIGDAVTVTEGSPIPIRQLTQGVVKAKIKKIGNGVEITDEAVLSGYGNPVDEAVDQLITSIASAVDNDLLAALQGNTTNVYQSDNAIVSATDIANGLALFGEDIDGEKVALVDAKTYASLRTSSTWLPASDIAAEVAIRGAVGMTQGCQVIITNRIKDGSVQIVKPGALGLFLKRDTMVEADRDTILKTTVLTADKHYVGYLLDATKAINIKAKAATPESPTPTESPEVTEGE